MRRKADTDETKRRVDQGLKKAGEMAKKGSSNAGIAARALDDDGDVDDEEAHHDSSSSDDEEEDSRSSSSSSGRETSSDEEETSGAAKKKKKHHKPDSKKGQHWLALTLTGPPPLRQEDAMANRIIAFSTRGGRGARTLNKAIVLGICASLEDIAKQLQMAAPSSRFRLAQLLLARTTMLGLKWSEGTSDRIMQAHTLARLNTYSSTLLGLADSALCRGLDDAESAQALLRVDTAYAERQMIIFKSAHAPDAFTTDLHLAVQAAADYVATTVIPGRTCTGAAPQQRRRRRHRGHSPGPRGRHRRHHRSSWR